MRDRDVMVTVVLPVLQSVALYTLNGPVIISLLGFEASSFTWDLGHGLI